MCTRASQCARDLQEAFQRPAQPAMCVLARPCRPIDELADVDVLAIGVYSVRLLDAADPAHFAQIVLGSFHDACAFANVNDFVFHVFDPDTHIVLQSERGDSLSPAGVRAEVAQISHEAPLVFACARLAGEAIVADSELEAHQLERAEFVRRAQLDALLTPSQERPRQ